MPDRLENIIQKIAKPDARAQDAARAHWNAIAKPIGGLGAFEEILAQIAGIQGTKDIGIGNRTLLVFCADNGVVEEGVTQTGQEVTAQVAENILAGKASSAILAEATGTRVLAVDIGMAYPTSVSRKWHIADGTRNFAVEPAMTREQALQSILAGVDLARSCRADGTEILLLGEMGIGNTTTSSAIASVLLHLPVEEMTGRGAGLSTTGLQKKIRVIREAIELHAPDPNDPVDVLAKVGGFDIGGLAGAILGAASVGLPVVLDGLISGVAALIACRMAPSCADYLIASHASRESAAQRILRELDKHAVIDAGMMLGEGSGALMLLPLLDLALRMYRNMPTFSDTDIEAYRPLQ